MPEIFVCGPASWNQIVNLDELPLPVPHMQFASSSYETLGDTSAGKALHLSELGRSVFLHAVLGSDEARDSGVPIWTDIHDYDGSAAFHRPFIEAASFIFMNADRLPQPLDFMHATVAAGASIVVCTLGADGAIAVDSAQRVLRVPTVPVDHIIDTSGAGDAFFAGLLRMYLDDVAYPDAVAHSGQGIGGDFGIAAALTAGAHQAAQALGTQYLSPLLDDADRR